MLTGIMLALLALGVLFIFWGYQARSSLASEISEFVSGTPTDEAVWYLAIGIALVVLSLAGLWKVRRRPSP